MKDCKYLKIPFDRYDTPYLESLPNEVFFAKRFTVSEEDQEIIDKHTYDVDGRKFYRARVVEPIYRKYAAMTNPDPGEPGTMSNPLIRFGHRYVYNREGRLSELLVRRKEEKVIQRFTLTPEMKPTLDQAKMIQRLVGRPIAVDDDCPELTAEQIQEFIEYARRRNAKRLARQS